VSNDANGRVSFGDFTYGAADAGKTFTYTIAEVAGTDETVIYDSSLIRLTVRVTKNADGAIVAEGTYEGTTDGGTYAVTDNPTFVNEYDTVAIHAVKRSREEPYDPLPGAHYGLWMVNPGGEDVYMGLGRNQLEVEGSELVSSDNGDLYYDIPLLEGVAYYFLEEWPPPAGHLVDPYPTDYFTLVHDKENGKFRLVYEADADFSKYCPGITR
jgi:pilin isopeptide linkage protein